MKKITIIAAALIAAATPAWAETTTGQTLLEDCRNFSASNQYFKKGVCLGFVLAASEVFSGAGLFCFPKGVTLAISIDVVERYLNEHPEQRHLGALILINSAMSKAYPCK